MYKLPENINDFSYKNIQDLSSKKVLVRSCLNVATDESGKVTDRTRLDESMPLISELAGNVSRLVLMAHLGRPENKEKQFSFWNVAELIQSELNKTNPGVKLMLVEDLAEVKNAAEDKNIVYLLENIRFFKAEESKVAEDRMTFAKELAALGDVFVNDAFADYRESASTFDVATILPSYIGPKFLQEIEALSKFSNPQRPFVAVLGGAKLSEKLDALKALGAFADKVLVGGAMAYTLLKSDGVDVGSSLVENDKIEVAKEIMTNFRDKLSLPIDHFVSKEFTEESAKIGSYTDEQTITEGRVGIDIGKSTIEKFKKEISEASSILWNGPMGVFEWSETELGTKSVIEAIIANSESYKLAGGGDSIAALNKFNLSGFNHVSTGGGAMLAFLAYEKFPTLDVIIK